jgi:O-antigen ligase
MGAREGKQSSIGGTVSFMLSAWRNPDARMFNTDMVLVLAAAALPWSTSIFTILMALWFVSLLFNIEPRSLASLMRRPACWLPVALFALALLGMLWSPATWSERIHAAGAVGKLLVLPLLLYHFARSPRGTWVMAGFLISCVLLMAMSFLVLYQPDLTLKQDIFTGEAFEPARGIFVKNYIDQSQEFALCAVALIYPIFHFFREGRTRLALLFCAVALGLLANMVFVTVSRTAMVTMPVMLAAFAVLHVRWRTSFLILSGLVLLALLAWTVSPSLRASTERFSRDYQAYKQSNEPTSIGLRIEYWTKSLRFIADAPLFGHGTGSTRALFERAKSGPEELVQAKVVSNPHNQTLAFAIQWGAVGVVILYAMWIAHLALFRGEGLMAWIGLLVVVQNMLTSLFNSHLIDFVPGWIYVLGVGIAGGTVLGARARSGIGHADAVSAASQPASENTSRPAT